MGARGGGRGRWGRTGVALGRPRAGDSPRWPRPRHRASLFRLFSYPNPGKKIKGGGEGGECPAATVTPVTSLGGGGGGGGPPKPFIGSFAQRSVADSAAGAQGTRLGALCTPRASWFPAAVEFAPFFHWFSLGFPVFAQFFLILPHFFRVFSQFSPFLPGFPPVLPIFSLRFPHSPVFSQLPPVFPLFPLVLLVFSLGFPVFSPVLSVFPIFSRFSWFPPIFPQFPLVFA